MNSNDDQNIVKLPSPTSLKLTATLILIPELLLIFSVINCWFNPQYEGYFPQMAWYFFGLLYLFSSPFPIAAISNCKNRTDISQAWKHCLLGMIVLPIPILIIWYLSIFP